MRAGTPPLPDRLLASLAAAVAYQSIGRPADAVERLRVLVEQQPHNLEALALLRGVQLDLGAWSELTLTCARILAHTPGDDQTLIIRARAWCETDRPAAAVKDLDQVLAQDPGRWPALAVRSVAHLLLERPQQALADADAAITAGADIGSLAAEARMLALLALDRRREAEEAARRIVAARPDDDVARRVVEAADARWQTRVDTLVSLAKAALTLFGG